MSSIFETLNKINVNGHTEKREVMDKKTGRKTALTYLSWAWAWAEVKKAFPDATYTVYKRPDGVNYWTDGRTCWVETGLTINGLEHIEMLPVMDFANRSVTLENVTSMDVNKAIQRSLTKAAARHGLGLYIYAGEDLPDGEEESTTQPSTPQSPAPVSPVQKMPAQAPTVSQNNAQKVIAWCRAHNMNTDKFQHWRDVAVDGGIIPDKKVADLTADELKNLITFVEANAA